MTWTNAAMRQGRMALAAMIILVNIATGVGVPRSGVQANGTVVVETLCASPATGVVSWVRAGCPAGYLAINLADAPVELCWDRYTGRVYQARPGGCQQPFQTLTLDGIQSVALCASFYTGAVRYALNGQCLTHEASIVPILKNVLDNVTLDGVREHQAALQAIADANNGTRVSGTSGYDASVDYAQQVFQNAGYNVTVQPFEYQAFFLNSPSILEQVSPSPAGPVAANTLSYSGSGDVTAVVTALAAPPGDPTPGCDAADYAGFPAGNIALISRGDCTFAIKATNAFSAGATGVIIYNNLSGQFPGTLGSDFAPDIGVAGISQDLGVLLVNTPGLVMRLRTDTFRGLATSYNVLAESPGGNPDDVMIVGAHLDSVDSGPGIEDNGSGVAAVLEVAEQLASVTPVRKLRFALWGAKEAGLRGSTHYVSNLSPAEIDDISLYLNFDMIGSLNFVFFVYDGDDSDATGVGPGPAGSAQIEDLFESYYTARGLPFKGTDPDGESDYEPFGTAGIPFGGLFTGSSEIKTVDEAALWGGTAGDQYDPCFHLPCDTYDNVSLYALDVNADAVAFATLSYAMGAMIP